jgi:hypothetical protein
MVKTITGVRKVNMITSINAQGFFFLRMRTRKIEHNIRIEHSTIRGTKNSHKATWFVVANFITISVISKNNDNK